MNGRSDHHQLLLQVLVERFCLRPGVVDKTSRTRVRSWRWWTELQFLLLKESRLGWKKTVREVVTVAGGGIGRVVYRRSTLVGRQRGGYTRVYQQHPECEPGRSTVAPAFQTRQGISLKYRMVERAVVSEFTNTKSSTIQGGEQDTADTCLSDCPGGLTSSAAFVVAV